MALDWSFEPDPDLKGSYYRRLEDIPNALAKFDVTALPANSPAQFVAYYFGAEKLAKAIVGINGGPTSEDCFSSSRWRQTAENQICRAQHEAHNLGSRPRCPIRASIAPPAAVERDHDPQSPVARFRTDTGEPHPPARAATDADHGQLHR